ncbi:hypothetical protein ACTQ3A_07250 [Bilifractor sp. LCP21S3_F8]
MRRNAPDGKESHRSVSSVCRLKIGKKEEILMQKNTYRYTII